MPIQPTIAAWPSCRRRWQRWVNPEIMQHAQEHVFQVRELLRHLAGVHGEPLNATRIGRKMGVSCHTILRRLAVLRRFGIVRLLPSTASHRPILYLRDCRQVAARCMEDEAALRGCLVERVIAAYRALVPQARFYHWQTARVQRLDLVAASTGHRIGFRFTTGPYPRSREVASLLRACSCGEIKWGFIVHLGDRATVRVPMFISLPAPLFLQRLDRWLACGDYREALRLLRG